MKKRCIITFIILIVLVLLIGAIFLLKKTNKDRIINKTYEIIEENNIQKNKDIKDANDLYVKIDGNNVIGIIKIEKIKYEGLIFEGTTMDILDKGIGHFKSSPLIDGNVCLAGHNYYNVWKNLNKLEKGDNIEYTCIFGKKNYRVSDIRQIEDTDTSVLENTQDNIITLITCVKNKPSKRLCVQAIEI